MPPKRTETSARQHAYYLANKEKMTAQILAARDKRAALGRPNAPSSFRRKDARSPERRAKIKEYRLKRTYGISLTEFNTICGKQEGCCAICVVPFGPKLLARVDHCHGTGKVRALLCDHCNRGLGDFKDSVGVMESAIRYLLLHANGN